MKNEEDEAFDDLAKRQSAWGGGYQAKRQMAADKLLEKATRSCNHIDEQRALDDLMREALAQPTQEPYDQTALELCNVCGWKTLIPDDGCLNCERAQPAQEPVNLLEARKIAAEYKMPDSQVDNGNLYFALSKCLEHIDAQPAQEPVAYVTGMSFGRFIVEPLNPAMVLPVGMAFYSLPQGNK